MHFISNIVPSFHWTLNIFSRMEPNSLEAGLESLCLDDELSRVVATRLGAIPKIFPSQASPLPPLLPPAAARLAPPTTPAVLRRQQKKKNRKDRRRNTDADEAGIQHVLFRVWGQNLVYNYFVVFTMRFYSKTQWPFLSLGGFVANSPVTNATYI